MALPEKPGFTEAYRESAALAFEQIRLRPVSEICRRSGAVQRNNGLVSVRYLGDDYEIDLERGLFLGAGAGLSPADRLVILHYLAGSGPVGPGYGPVTFKELPGGLVYYPSFEKRAIAPLLSVFGHDVTGLVIAAENMGATATAQGDAGITIPALPNVTVGLSIWASDRELPASGSYYFSVTIGCYLPTEDVAVLCQAITGRLTGRFTEGNI